MTEKNDSTRTRMCANLIDVRGMIFIDSGTREYAAAQYCTHVAGQDIIIESKISSYFANLFLKFCKPKVPTKLFTNEVDAEKWLRQQMEQRK